MALQERSSTLAPQQRWAPARDVEQVADRMRTLLEETFGASPLLAEVAAWTPPVNVEETDDAYIVEAELPGVKRDDANIELVGNELTISGEIKEKERVGILRRRTRKTGRFEYRIAFPTEVDGEKIDARLNDGVLTVQVPKAQREQRRKIEVS